MKFNVFCPLDECQCIEKKENMCDWRVKAWFELNNKDIVTLECERLQKHDVALNIAVFQILFDMGIKSVIDGYYKEAVSDFASSLERFFEYFIFTILINEGKPIEEINKLWKNISSQSERQLGCFYGLYLQKFNKNITVKGKCTEFRNKVIHKGFIPTELQVLEYAEYIYNFIMGVLKELYNLYYSETNDSETTLEKLETYIEYCVKKVETKTKSKVSWVTFIDFYNTYLVDRDISFKNLYEGIKQEGFAIAYG